MSQIITKVFTDHRDIEKPLITLDTKGLVALYKPRIKKKSTKAPDVS